MTFIADITATGAVDNLYGFLGFDPSNRNGIQYNVTYVPNGGPGGRNAIRVQYIPLALGQGFGSNLWFGSTGESSIPYGSTRVVKYYINYSNVNNIKRAQDLDPWGVKEVIIGATPDTNRAIATIAPHTGANEVLQLRWGKNIDGLPNETRPDIDYQTGWHAVQLVFQAPTAAGVPDARYKVYYDNDNVSLPNAINAGPTLQATDVMGGLEFLAVGEPISLNSELTILIGAIEFQNEFDNQWFANMEQDTPVAQPLAFPGAEGFGSETRHAYGLVGTDPTIIHVTNLNDNGAGSLREALTTAGPRVVVFDTSGTIPLASDIVIDDPYCYLAGQSAPAPGILIKGYGLIINADDVFITHVRVRIGDLSDVNSGFGIIARDCERVIVDHCSISWSCRQAIGTFQGVLRATFSNCIFGEALDHPISTGQPSNAALFEEFSGDITVVRNLFIHNINQLPEVWSDSSVQFVNNIVYDYGQS